MRGIYGFLIATVGFAMWLVPLLMIAFGVYRLFGGSLFGFAFIVVGALAFVFFKRLAGGLVNAGDIILSEEMRKQDRDS